MFSRKNFEKDAIMRDLVNYYSSSTHISELTEGLGISEEIRNGLASDPYNGLMM